MTRFRAITPMLKTSDIEATALFYTDLLGFELDGMWPEESPTLCFLDRDSTHLVFDTGADWDSHGSPPTLTGQLSIEVDDVDGLFERVRGRVEIVWGPEDYHYGRREFSIRDPNGYRLVFSQRIGSRTDGDQP